jgi:hypothetical protein
MAKKCLKSKVMADIQILGHISNIKYLSDSILVVVDENKNGYMKPNGERVDSKVLTWKCIFSGNESKRNYINKYFNRGMLVQIKGEILPYAVEHGQLTEGYSVFIQTLNRASYPTTTIKQERRLIKDSQLNSTERPDLETYNQPDF